MIEQARPGTIFLTWRTTGGRPGPGWPAIWRRETARSVSTGSTIFTPQVMAANRGLQRKLSDGL